MVIFHSYVSLPEGMVMHSWWFRESKPILGLGQSWARHKRCSTGRRLPGAFASQVGREGPGRKREKMVDPPLMAILMGNIVFNIL